MSSLTNSIYSISKPHFLSGRLGFSSITFRVRTSMQNYNYPTGRSQCDFFYFERDLKQQPYTKAFFLFVGDNDCRGYIGIVHRICVITCLCMPESGLWLRQDTSSFIRNYDQSFRPSTLWVSPDGVYKSDHPIYSPFPLLLLNYTRV